MSFNASLVSKQNMSEQSFVGLEVSTKANVECPPFS